MELQYETRKDPFTGDFIERPKRVPSEIYYKDGSVLRSKTPDANDLSVLAKIEAMQFPSEVPGAQFPDCQMMRVGRMATTKVQSVNDLYVPRSAQTMATLWRKARAESDSELRRFMVFLVEQAIWGLSTLNRYQPSQLEHVNYGGSQVNRQLNGVYYLSSMNTQNAVHGIIWAGKVRRLASRIQEIPRQTQQCRLSLLRRRRMQTTYLFWRLKGLPDDSVDYIFTDPPFGENIYYADLNFLVESWHEGSD